MARAKAVTRTCAAAVTFYISSVPVAAQGIIQTFIGVGGFVDNVPGTVARLDGPAGLAVDREGNAYLSEGFRIRRVDRVTGIISTVAGNPNLPESSADGPSSSIGIKPMQLAFDPQGNLLFVSRQCIRKLDLQTKILTSFSGPCGVFQQGPLGAPVGLAVDSAGNAYVSDTFTRRILKIDAATRLITAIAGGSSLTPGLGDGGPAINATFAGPDLLAVDAMGNIYVTDYVSPIRRIDAASGVINTVVVPKTFSFPSSVAVDSQGNVFYGSTGRVDEILAGSGRTLIVAGTGEPGYYGDGIPATQAKLGEARGLTVDGAGNLWIADFYNTRVRVVSAGTGLIRTVAGTAVNGDGGAVQGATVGYVSGVAVNSSGDVFIADLDRVRRVDGATGIITTVAGGGNIPAIDRGRALDMLIRPERVGIDPMGNTMFSERSRVWRIENGELVKVAGSSREGFGGDGGQATDALLQSPFGFVFDPFGNLFIADFGNGRVRRVDAITGIITTVAGGGQPFLAVGVPELGATGYVFDIATATNGELLIVGDPLTNAVLRLNAQGSLAAIAGNGACGYAGDGGNSVLASLCRPTSIATDNAGNIFLGENTCHCIRRIAGSGTIQTIAGGGSGPPGEGTSATLGAIDGLSLAIAGDTLYIAEGPRVRVVKPATPPVLPVEPGSFAVIDAASFLKMPISPGEIVTLKGNYLGPLEPQALNIAADGRVANQLAGVELFFNDVPAPLLYVSAAQINAVVPYSVGTSGTLDIRLQTGGGSRLQQAVPLGAPIPTVFPSAVLNPNGTRNDATHRVPKGGILTVYGTGMGALNPSVPDGTVITGPHVPLPTTSFQATVVLDQGFGARVPCAIAYLGPVIGLVVGVMQANIVIPASATSGPAILELGSVQGASGTMIYIE